MMKAFLFVAVMWPGTAFAEPFVCFTDKIAAHELEAQIYLASAPSCQTLDKIETGLNATSLVLAGTGFGLACTGIGLPATVWLEGAAIGAQAVGLIVGQLPCDITDDARIKRLAGEVVCSELAKQGIACTL